MHNWLRALKIGLLVARSSPAPHVAVELSFLHKAKPNLLDLCHHSHRDTWTCCVFFMATYRILIS